VNLVNAALAFAAGVLSISSPCCLPLIPGYLSFLSGISQKELGRQRRRTVLAALLFVAGFSIVFISLGATASIVGSFLLYNHLPFARVAGVFIALLGLVLILEGRVGLLSRSGDWSHWFAGGKLWTAAPLGAAFAITWTPCIGPVLGAVLTLAGSTASLSQGVILLSIYSLGLALPFVALSFWASALRSLLQRVAHGAAVLQYASGALLVAMGVLLVTDRWLPLMAPVLAWYAQAQWPPI